MRLLKKSTAFALVAAMVVTMAPAGTADAAKKVKLNKKTASIQVGQTVKIKVKNAKKSAKVTWKTSKKKVAKIKKSSKKGNAYANVVGLKTGKSTITATYKVGKKKAQKLTCKVTVTKKVAPTPSQAPSQAPTGTPVVSAQPTTPAQPATDAPNPTPTKTPKPSPTPKPPTPTPMPNQDYNFAKVENAISIDVSTFNCTSGNGSYVKDKERVEINDADNANSQGYWNLPEGVPAIKVGDVVTFRIQGYNYGTSGFRFWIGDQNSGGCTPVLFHNEINEDLKIDDGGYPHVVDEEGNEVKSWTVSDNGEYTIDNDILNAAGNKTLNQVALSPDAETQAFDVEVSFKAGSSQNDTKGNYSTLTLKYIMEGANTINGLCIKNIYYIKGDEQPGTTDEPTDTPNPNALPKQDPNAQAVDGRAVAIKTDTAVTVDGVVDEAWDATDFVKLDYYSTEAGETNAQAKFMWDADNLYVLAVVADPSIDATSNNDYERDGIEVFLDEDNSKENTYADNADAFQYRFTGFKQGDDDVWAEALTAEVTGGNKTDYEINSAYKVYEGGYVVEIAIPFKNKDDIVADKVLGFELTVMDCAEGTRANEIWLTGAGKGEMYQNPSLFGEIKLVGPIDISSAKPLYGNGKVTVNDDGTVSGTNLDGIVLPLGRTINTGDKVNITVYAEAGVGTRLWLTDESNGVCSEQVNPLTLGTKCTVTATADNISLFQIKGSAYGVTFDTIKITKVFVEAVEE